MSEYFLLNDRKFVLATQEPEGEYTYFFHNEDRNCDLFEWDVRPCAAEGCPAVMLITDMPDMFYTRQWQYYLVAINPGVSLNQIWSLLGPTKFMTNRDPDEPCRNYILGEDLTAPSDPRVDKFRTLARETHAALWEGTRWRLVTMDGNLPPALKPGHFYPERLEDVSLDDYLYTPQTHRHLFCACKNIKTKFAGLTSISPFDGGSIRNWTGDNEPYTLFPFASMRPQYLPPDPVNWTRLEPGQPFPSTYRRV